jgi:hypothetical protein
VVEVPTRTRQHVFRVCSENRRLATISCLAGIQQRHQVVLWGRIRPKRLREALVASSHDADESEECPPDTLLTVEKLEQLFSQATTAECEKTIRFLVAGICHESSSQKVHDGKTCARLSLVPVESPPRVESKQDSSPTADSAMHTGTSTITVGGSFSSIQQLAAAPDIDDLVSRLAGLEHKIDILVQGWQQQLAQSR